MAYAFIAISLGLLWFVRMGSCASYALGWLGFLPMQLVMSVLLFLMARLFHPIKPGKDFVLSVNLPLRNKVSKSSMGHMFATGF